MTLLAGCTDQEPGSAPSSAVLRPTEAPPLLEPGPSSPPVTSSTGDDGGSLTTDQMLVDLSGRQQPIIGLGVDANVHSWKGGQLKSAIDRYTALGPMTWRVIIEKGDWEPTQVGQADVIDPAYYRGIYETPKMQDLWNTIAYIESSAGQTVSLSIMGGVSSWMGGTEIRSDKEDYWVRMVASLLDYGRRQKGLRLDLVSPFNEPDLNGIEGPKVDPAQMTELLRKLSRRLDAMGMKDVRFVAPDTASPGAAHDQYVPALLADPTVAAKIAYIGIHTYSGDSGFVPQSVSTSSAVGVWATEFNAPCDGCDSGSEPADSWDHAFGMARDLLTLIDQGVSGAQLYDAWDGYYEHHAAMGYWGALKYNSSSGAYTPRQSFGVLALFLTSIPPGSVHVASTGAQALDSEAFLDPTTGTLTVVGANPTSSSQRFRIQVTGASALAKGHLRIVTAKGGESAGKAPTVQGSSFIATVPGQSVFVVSVSQQ